MDPRARLDRTRAITLRSARRAISSVLENVEHRLGRAIVRATRAARRAVRLREGLSPHGVVAGAVTASAALIESSAGALAGPVVALAADAATVAIAVHAVRSMRSRVDARVQTYDLFVRSVQRVAGARDVRAGRWVLASETLRRDGLQWSATASAAGTWARRAIVPAMIGSAVGAIPGVGGVMKAGSHAAAVLRNYAFVHAVECEAERLIAGQLARVPMEAPANAVDGYVVAVAA